ncbi:efflux RND transporter periplasmic adaptor subunit [Sphingomonas sp. KR1UV-12]|uniref:Efflux RND transporter periplasmic adaptor subunit n=1 Tax=Sphingomonas aurea TaxID=3063994 RepID=A0ABT9EN07_9SPHN|nr:efflux RND transporter periplasmic adaptor subunit [Sphingomonas sp. KR1UV-12]MDP1028329.1 efflux RND transporter periplasmic adaptor subunit [Sphingomonas sp. KR1UV-12]
MNYEPGVMAPERLTGPEAPGSRRRWIVAAAVVAVLAVAIALWAFAGKKPDAPAAGGGEQLSPVTVVVPGRKAAERTLSATGSIAARREMPVGVAGEGGIVTRVLVEPGQWVKAGQVLATVDRSVQTQTAASLGAQVNVARADLTLAQAELDRANALVDRGFISKADLQRRTATRDAAAARVKVAGASFKEAQARNGRLDIRAPAEGLVLTRGVEAGQIVSSGSGMLFRIAQGGQMELRAQLSEGDLAGLHVGAPAKVTPIGADRSYSGEVWQISPVVDPSTRQGIARIALRYDPALRPGGFGTAAIVSGSSALPLLPESAVMTDGKGSFVYVVGKDDKVERRAIKIGEVSDSGIAVAEGLNGTERVVLSAGAFLNPGQKVKPIRQAQKG